MSLINDFIKEEKKKYKPLEAKKGDLVEVIFPIIIKDQLIRRIRFLGVVVDLRGKGLTRSMVVNNKKTGIYKTSKVFRIYDPNLSLKIVKPNKDKHLNIRSMFK